MGQAALQNKFMHKKNASVRREFGRLSRWSVVKAIKPKVSTRNGINPQPLFMETFSSLQSVK